MTRYVLSLLRDDRAILTTEATLSMQEALELKREWQRWQENGGLAIVAECRVQHLDSIELLFRDGELVPA